MLEGFKGLKKWIKLVIAHTTNLNIALALQQNFFEHNVLCFLDIAIALFLQGKLEASRFANSGACNIELPMRERLGAEPKPNFFQCLTWKEMFEKEAKQRF